MEIAFGVAIVVISLTSALVAFLTYLRVGEVYRQIGRPSRELSPLPDDGPADRIPRPARSDE
jgi:hypothetical protein